MLRIADYISRTVFLMAFIIMGLIGEVRAESDENAVDLLIHNARIIDGTGKVIEQGSVAVTGNRIIAVKSGTDKFQAVQEIDAKGRVLMPGYIDTHRHLLFNPAINNDEALNEWLDKDLAGMLKAYLDSGFTTVMSAGDFYPAILNIKNRINDGSLPGPRLLIVSHAFTAPDGHPSKPICRGDPWCVKLLSVEVTDEETARAKVRMLAQTGIDGYKVMFDGRLGAKLDVGVLAAIIDEAAQIPFPVYLHATDVQDAITAVELGVKRLVHPPFFGAVAGTRAGRVIREQSVLVSTTVTRGLGVNDENRRQARMNVRELWDQGVTIAFGTDTPLKPARSLALELSALIEILSPEQIITALTRNAAEFLGLSAEIGTLEAGKTADLVMLAGDPVADITMLSNVVLVIRNGAILIDKRQ